MRKDVLLKQLLALVATRIEGFERSARAAHEEATDEGNKAENKYDTRALEASYLAEGQTRQAFEVAQSLELLSVFQPPEFGPKDPIDLGALLLLKGKDEETWYFIAPCEGGSELECDGQTVIVLTPQAPLAKLLIGQKLGASIKMQIGRDRLSYQVTRLS